MRSSAKGSAGSSSVPELGAMKLEQGPPMTLFARKALLAARRGRDKMIAAIRLRTSRLRDLHASLLADSALLAIPAQNWHRAAAAASDGGWVGTASFWVAVAGLIIAIAGLRLRPFSKWRRARRAKGIEEQFSVRHLKHIMDDLDDAIETENRQLIRRHLDRWRELASKVHGMLPDVTAEDQAVRRCLKKSISAARAASTALLEGGPAGLPACVAARKAITAAFDALSSWVARQSIQGLGHPAGLRGWDVAMALWPVAGEATSLDPAHRPFVRGFTQLRRAALARGLAKGVPLSIPCLHRR